MTTAIRSVLTSLFSACRFCCANYETKKLTFQRYIIGILFLVNAIHDFVLRSAEVQVRSLSFFPLFCVHSLQQVLSLPNFYKSACVVFFAAECVIMLLSNALIFLDACADPSNLQKYKTDFPSNIISHHNLSTLRACEHACHELCA